MIDRRSLLTAGAVLLASPLLAAETFSITELRAIERARLVPWAMRLLRQKPRTITAIPAARSPAGPHDYYSEGDYWWPDPAGPGGPYVRRDGLSNPNKFDGHRDALIAFGVAVPTLTGAWALTGDRRFAAAAIRHLEAWFVTPETRMNPNLAHAQAIIGVNSGRAIGIIDTLQIVEVARAAEMLARRDAPDYRRIRSRVKAWFAAYLEWMTGSPAGREERDQENNHGTCWLLQVAAFASLLGRADLLAAMRTRLMETIAPAQIADDGRQPLELARTKPFAYSLFNLDVLAAAAWLLSHSHGELILQRTASGRSIADAIAFMAPFIADRSRWPFARDVEHFDDFPVRHPSLLFGALAQDRAEWLALWRTLDADPTVAEVVRNYPVRQPLLWIDGTL